MTIGSLAHKLQWFRDAIIMILLRVDSKQFRVLIYYCFLMVNITPFQPNTETLRFSKKCEATEKHKTVHRFV